MEQEKKIELLAEMLELGKDELSADILLSDIQEWDSLAALSFVVLVDENFGKSITGNQIRECKTIGDLMLLMQ